MKITIERDDGTTEVFQEVLEYYIAVRQVVPLQSKDLEFAMEVQTKSFSRTQPGAREILKELRQSIIEIEKWQPSQAES